MPIIEYPDSTLVTTQPDLDDLIAHIRHVGRFAFDTEFVSEETFEPVLCLVQVATRD
jgi:ribonuclease D